MYKFKVGDKVYCRSWEEEAIIIKISNYIIIRLNNNSGRMD